MKYRINGPASREAQQVWEIIEVATDIVQCVCFTFHFTNLIFDLLLGDSNA